jgi:hypothetical protein
VTRELGVADEIAERGFDQAPADPGAVSSGAVATTAGGTLYWIDATAANDPDSLAQLVVDTWGDVPARDLALVYNHRADRGPRLSTFARHSRAMRDAHAVVVTGVRPPLSAWLALRRVREPRGTAFVARRRLAAHLRALPEDVRPSYRALARLTADRALASGRLKPEQAEGLLGVLS